MGADLTREQAREQVARAIWDSTAPIYGWESAVRLGISVRRARINADAALTVLWPVVESLRAELAHAHTVIARHVEPKRSTGSWDQKWPSDALCGDLTGEGCGSGVSGRVDETGGSE